MNLEQQEKNYNSSNIKKISIRIKYLKELKYSIKNNEEEILNALHKDLGKSHFEGYMTEVGMVLKELTYFINNLKKWSKTKKVKTSLMNIHSSSYIVKQPLGHILIISPWNYPFLLALQPLIAAIAAGNICTLKLSEYSIHTNIITKKILREIFEPELLKLYDGGIKESTMLLERKYDHIFFTGSTAVGKIVYKKASSHLTPVTLELGGKSPCIIDESANLDAAATNIAFAKFLNVGQICVAPDYILIDSKIKAKFIDLLINKLKAMYTIEPLTNKDYGKIINKVHFNRLLSLISNCNIIYGGKSDSNTLKIEPTIIDNINEDSLIMQEEIFGPLLPIIEYNDFSKVKEMIDKSPNPLSAYLFSENKINQDYFMNELNFGGGCINDCLVHLTSDYLPFGGIGNSGIGKYHGIYSFNTFTHEKAILKRYTWINLPIKNQPYTKFKETLIRFFMK